MPKLKRDIKGRFFGEAGKDSKACYGKIKVEYDKRVRRILKKKGYTFSYFLNSAAEWFIRKNGDDNKIYKALSVCNLCGGESEFDFNFFCYNDNECVLDKEGNVKSYCYQAICPDCKTKLLETDKETLSKVELSFREQLLDEEGSCWDGFIEYAEDCIELMEYQIVEPGKILLNELLMEYQIVEPGKILLNELNEDENTSPIQEENKKQEEKS